MEIKEIALSALKPYEKNPRRNDKAVKGVLKSIQTFGFKIPLVVDKDNVIICGHTRYKAAQKLGFESVPCIIANDLSEEQVKAFRLIDNKTAELAEWDSEKLGEELKSLAAELIAEFSFELPNQEELNHPVEGVQPKQSAKKDFESVTFAFNAEQKAIVEDALSKAALEIKNTFGNKNIKGNALYEVVRQWAEQKKLS